MAKIQSVDHYIDTREYWHDELIRLRAILQDLSLTETIKWGMPCYTYAGKNVVGLVGFQAYFGLWFHQGALINDTHNKLINAQEGKTKALRQWRMTHRREIKPTIIKRYLKEAIANVEQGIEIKASYAASTSVPDELQCALKKSVKTRTAFDALSSAQQRQYARYVSEAKQQVTRLRRVDKIIPMIRQGVGLHDRYR